jgi:hypothetical protein
MGDAQIKFVRNQRDEAGFRIEIEAEMVDNNSIKITVSDWATGHDITLTSLDARNLAQWILELTAATTG